MQHLDEGTIHAWLDGALDAGESERVAAHAAACPECGATVAEARGLVAAASRILGALDATPGGVVPPAPAARPAARPAAGPRPWASRRPVRIAAGFMIAAVGLGVIARGGGRDALTSAASEESAASSAAGSAAGSAASAVRREEAEMAPGERPLADDVRGSAPRPPAAKLVVAPERQGIAGAPRAAAAAAAAPEVAAREAMPVPTPAPTPPVRPGASASLQLAEAPAPPLAPVAAVDSAAPAADFAERARASRRVATADAAPTAPAPQAADAPRAQDGRQLGAVSRGGSAVAGAAAATPPPPPPGTGARVGSEGVAATDPVPSPRGGRAAALAGCYTVRLGPWEPLPAAGGAAKRVPAPDLPAEVVLDQAGSAKPSRDAAASQSAAGAAGTARVRTAWMLNADGARLVWDLGETRVEAQVAPQGVGADAPARAIRRPLRGVATASAGAGPPAARARIELVPASCSGR